jgi:phosphoribosylamine-glycine ligase
VEDIISNKQVQDYINSFSDKKKIAVYFFKSTPKIEQICEENDWRPLGSNTNLFEKLNDRSFFFELIDRIDFPREFKILNFNQFEKQAENIFKKIGNKIVLQTFDSAGGKGTYFFEKENYKGFIKKLKLESNQKIIISKFIDGFDVAVTGCVTKNNGTLVGPTRHQFVGIDEIVSGKENAEHSFCGNDWKIKNIYQKNIQKQAETIIKKIGKVLKKEAYLGIFGVDFIYDKKNNKLVPLEINPRLIGSYPVETQYEVANNKLPLVGFHILDFLNLKYKLKTSKNTKEKRVSNCSHVMLVNFFGKNLKFKKDLKGGVYCLDKNKIVFLRKGFRLNDLKKSKEFILSGGVPTKGYPYKKNNQLLRIIWKKSIQIKNASEINNESKKIIKKVKKLIKDSVDD